MRRIASAILATVALVAPACAQTASRDLGQSEGSLGQATTSALDVRYVGNEGFLVEGAGQRVLVDGLVGNIEGYIDPPAEIRNGLEDGTGEWRDVRVAMATHHHRDHFDAESTIRFLEANRGAIFVSTPQAFELFSDQLGSEYSHREDLLGRFRAILPAEGVIEPLEIEGIRIDVLNLHHGRRTPPVENLGFIVTLGRHRFLHFGDTEAKMEDFEPYLDRLRGTELALLPFWFLSSDWRAQMVRELIRPTWIVAAHLPTPDAPTGHFGRWRSYDNLLQVMREAFPSARFATDPGASYHFDS